MTKTALAASVIALLATATTATNPVHAQSGAWRIGPDQIHLYYADLNMNSASGRAALLQRVEKAAVKLCRDRIMNDRKACEEDTVRLASTIPAGRMLARAMAERGSVAVASR